VVTSHHHCAVFPRRLLLLHALQHRFGHTTQLLADAGGADIGEAAHHREQLAAPHSAAAARSSLAGQQRQLLRASAAAAAAPGAAAGLEDCTTKLLADSTSASACGIVGLLPQPRAPLLTSTIAGGAPMGQPVAAVFGTAAAAAPAFPGSGGFVLPRAVAADGDAADGGADADMMDAEQQQQYEQSPELGARQASGAGDASVAGSPYAAAEGDDAAGAVDGSPLGHWQQQQGEQQEVEEEEQQMPGWQARSPSLSPLAVSQPGASPGLGAGRDRAGSAAAAAAADGSDATLELAAGVSQGLAGSGGLSLLEDATLEDFALPPEVAAAEERPITLPFSGVCGGGA
jgi:hypothetical protein